MARKQNTYICPVKSISVQEWTLVNGSLTALQNIRQESGGKQIVEPEAPSTSQGLTVAANSKSVEGLFEVPTLAEGEIVVKAELFVYGKAGSAAKDVEVHADSISFDLEATAENWYHSAIGEEEGAFEAEIEAFRLKSLKAQGGTVRTMYLKLTTETERAIVSSTVLRSGTTTASAEGKIENTQAKALELASVAAFLIIACVGAHGATSVTDAQGNTWTMDGEDDATVPGTTSQIWSSRLTKTLASSEKITITGLPALAVTNYVVFTLASGLGGIPSTSKVDVTGSAEAIGTELEVVTAATRKQGDFAIVLYATTADTVSFTPTGFTAPGAWNLAQTGLSIAGGYVEKPEENAAIKTKGKFGTTGSMAALVVAYKILANEGATVGKLEAVISLTATLTGNPTAKGVLAATGASTATVKPASTAKGILTMSAPATSNLTARGTAKGAFATNSAATSALTSLATAPGHLATLITSTAAVNAKGTARGILQTVIGSSSTWFANLKGKTEALKKTILFIFEE